MQKVLTVAEAGKNFITSDKITVKEALKNAKKLALVAKQAKADCVKYQCHVAEDELKKRHPKRHEWIQLNEILTSYRDFWLPLKEYCDEIGIEFMATPMSRLAAEKIEPLVKRWKVASPDIYDFLLLEYLKSTKKEIILSSGMTDKIDQDKAVNFIGGCPSILHCVSEYPCPPEHLNLWEVRFYDGLSDHSLSLVSGAMAVAMGAKIIEKHFTYDNWGKDAPLSLNPKQLRSYIINIRQAEFMMQETKRPTEKEQELLKDFWA